MVEFLNIHITIVEITKEFMQKLKCHMNDLQSLRVPVPGHLKRIRTTTAVGHTGRNIPRFKYNCRRRNWTVFCKKGLYRTIVAGTTDTSEVAAEQESSGNMSNHRILKPVSSSSLYREDDFRITAPNVTLSEVRL